jgi:hypothetical protein
LAGDIPGIEVGAVRLAQGIARGLVRSDAERHYERLLAHNEDEMKPTRYFVRRTSAESISRSSRRPA